MSIDRDQVELAMIRSYWGQSASRENLSKEQISQAISAYSTSVPFPKVNGLTAESAEQREQGQAVASIYITPSGEREFDDWKCSLPAGRNILYTTILSSDAKPANEQEAYPVEEIQDEIARLSSIIATNSFYQEGHNDGLEWAAQTVEYNDPRTGDWMWDDRNDLANVIRKGPEMPSSEPVEAPPAGVPDVWIDAMRDALSACSSVSISRDRRVVRDGCVLYLQTQEWCDWVENEVAPKLRSLLSAAPQPEDIPAIFKEQAS